MLMQYSFDLFSSLHVQFHVQCSIFMFQHYWTLNSGFLTSQNRTSNPPDITAVIQIIPAASHFLLLVGYHHQKKIPGWNFEFFENFSIFYTNIFTIKFWLSWWWSQGRLRSTHNGELGVWNCPGHYSDSNNAFILLWFWFFAPADSLELIRIPRITGLFAGGNGFL